MFTVINAPFLILCTKHFICYPRAIAHYTTFVKEVREGVHFLVVIAICCRHDIRFDDTFLLPQYHCLLRRRSCGERLLLPAAACRGIPLRSCGLFWNWACRVLPHDNEDCVLCSVPKDAALCGRVIIPHNLHAGCSSDFGTPRSRSYALWGGFGL